MATHQTGNTTYQQQNELPAVGTDDTEFTQAIDQFTAAIELNRNNYTLYSNRSAAYIRLGRYAETLELKPDWPKVNCAPHYYPYMCTYMHT